MISVRLRLGEVWRENQRTLSLAYVRRGRGFASVYHADFEALEMKTETEEEGKGEFRVVKFALPEGEVLRIFATTGTLAGKRGGKPFFTKTRTKGVIFRIERGDTLTWKGPYFNRETNYFRGQAYQFTSEEAALVVEPKFRRFYGMD